jgi:hypothetical protein
LVIAAAVTWALLVPPLNVGHGDRFDGPPIPIIEEDWKLRIGVLVGGALIAGLLFLVAWRSRSNRDTSH